MASTASGGERPVRLGSSREAIASLGNYGDRNYGDSLLNPQAPPRANNRFPNISRHAPNCWMKHTACLVQPSGPAFARRVASRLGATKATIWSRTSIVFVAFARVRNIDSRVKLRSFPCLSMSRIALVTPNSTRYCLFSQCEPRHAARPDSHTAQNRISE